MARGVRVAREVGAPLPYDFGVGKSMLGDLDDTVVSIENSYICSACSRPLDEEAANKIRSAALYDNIPVETRCAECRGKGAES